MPIIDRSSYNRKNKRYGEFYVRHYPGGGFNIWKENWKSPEGSFVPAKKYVIARYMEELEKGPISASLQTYLGFYGVLACGKRSQSEGRKFLGLPGGRKELSERQCVAIINDYWMPIKNEWGLFQPTKNLDKKMMDFMKAHQDVYKFLGRHNGGFRKLADSKYPGLYPRICRRREDKPGENQVEEVSRILIERFNSGQGISPDYLARSVNPEERELRRRVLELAKIGSLSFTFKNYTEIVHAITGIPVKDIKLNNGATKNCANLSEDLTAFLFYWNSLFGLDSFGFQNPATMFHSGKPLEFLQGEECYRADFRVGNHAIEVKTGITRFRKARESDIIKKYSNPGVWRDGEDLEKAAIIFHASLDFHNYYSRSFAESGLQVISYEDFHTNLSRLISTMNRNQKLFRDVRPLAPLDRLLELHEEVSLHPFLLVREENLPRREWLHQVLVALINRAREIRGVEI